MRKRFVNGGSAFWKSAMIGAFSGTGMQLALAAWGEPIKTSELWAIPMLIGIYGLLAVPFVATGLALFGLPLTHLLRPKARSPWVGAVAIVWGAMAGKIVFFAIDHLIFFGGYDISKIAFPDMGILYGTPTGVAWWLLQRGKMQNVGAIRVDLDERHLPVT